MLEVASVFFLYSQLVVATDNQRCLAVYEMCWPVLAVLTRVNTQMICLENLLELKRKQTHKKTPPSSGTKCDTVDRCG